MKKNIGNADRIIRVILAVVFASLYFSGIIPGTLGIVLTVAGLVLLLTSVINFCPIYYLLGLNSLRAKN